ncbi:MAG: HEAT repeat domain-containing protein [Limisphaerales bacterium]
MLEKKLPLVYSNDVVREERFRKFAGLPQKEGDVHKLGELPLGSYNKLLPFARYDELLPYAKVTKTDLPAFNKINPRLAEKSWWLTKQTWTFKPDEMHDLEFEPALSFFAKLLDSKYGYFAAESLTSFGADGVPMIITAIQSTNPAIRINAAARGNIPRENLLPFLKSADPEFLDWAIAIFLYQKGTMFDNDATFLLQNLHPVARMRGLDVLCWHPEKQSVELALPLLKDPDKLVRSKAAQTLRVLTSQHFTEDQADQWQAWWTINKTNFVF